MAFLDSFKKKSQIERELLSLYTDLFISQNRFPAKEAKQMANQLLKDSISKSKEEGTLYLPSNFGDIILERAKCENTAIERIASVLRHNLPLKRDEGVKDVDILWYWNMHDLERGMMSLYDELTKAVVFIEKQKQLNNTEQAAKQVKKIFPIYCVLLNEGDLNDDDRKLPVELKDRVNKYGIERMKVNPNELKRQLENSSSYNAFIRQQIKSGKI